MPTGRKMHERAAVGLYLLYVVAIVTMLAIYLLTPAPERWEFYRRSLATWTHLSSDAGQR
jgi:hypothetical protein